MKVSVEFDLNDPMQNKLLHQLLGAMSPGNTVAEQPVAQAPMVTQPQATAAAVAAPVAPQPAAAAAEPPPSATPMTDLNQELMEAFNRAYAIRPNEAMQVAEQCRAEFGPDKNNWTQEQLKVAVTRTQALLVM